MLRPLLAFSTAPSPEKAAEIARALVEEGLAACVNILPGARSIYRWKGATCDDVEVVLLIKTTSERLPALVDRLPALHPYEVPELIAVDVAGGLPAYLAWMASPT